MQGIYIFPKPARFDLAEIRARVDAALGAPYSLFEGEDHLRVEVADPDAMADGALGRLREAFDLYVFAPRQHAVTAPARFRLGDVGAALAALAIPGYTGASSNGTHVIAEFPERLEPLTAEEQAAIEGAIAAYTFSPNWDEVRALRAPLLEEADIQFNKALDTGAPTAPISAYRQALRDVTKQADPDNVTWPTKPW